MGAFVVVLAAAFATWLLRIAFIGVVPVDRLPARVRRTLDDVGPAVLAAILATSLLGAGEAVAFPTRPLLAAVLAGVVAWRTSNLPATVASGVVGYGLLGLVGLA
jgi:branched-subunit amino acid transport protein